MTRRIEIVSYNPTWKQYFEEEAKKIRTLLGPELVTVHHIGSTAIPGIKSKPTIDILPEVRDIQKVGAFNTGFAKLGYEARGEYGIPGRRYFVRRQGETHLYHMHAFQTGNPEITRTHRVHEWRL